VCSSKKAVKYIYKYVYKGSDKATITIEVYGQNRPINEIRQYLNARYISPTRRAFDFSAIQFKVRRTQWCILQSTFKTKSS
jgi:hypothetical protein